MTTLVDQVRGKLDDHCIVQRMKKQGCKVSLEGAPQPRLIVDFDKPGSPLPACSTRCDYLLVAECERARGWVAVLELKRGQLRPSQVVGQLQAGAYAAERIVPRDFVSPSETFRFRPVAVAKSVPKYARVQLKKADNIRFHGHREPVRLMSCGGTLEVALRR